jgi:hypothetical protein
VRGRVSVDSVVTAERVENGGVGGHGERGDAEAAVDLVGFGLGGAGDGDSAVAEAVR